ncbi:recombinase family protein [Faecalicatena contorta]|uniref:Site-specific DNA recombinase n=1 Tax=Faecalicatena contorta TaxID=39482 RepID=A0A315ZS32_9FIRM|nr:recombinase family protein [Faecalicatena contorta]PWJ48102.1 DNA invertase Pin-like site-specific DNA recombinase [Faecalicatena contorta]SUQ15629.1 Site-specific DNA recombinase [Faecalicatena contorta]
MLKKYLVALYCRLSRADAEFGQVVNESESIKNQIDQLLKYTTEMPEHEYMEILVFVDDGYTGRNFKRPDFIKLHKMILEKKVDCIIVKDFSRFGRDYIELGDYLEQIFPMYGIRFISVNDHYDTKLQTEPNPVDVGFKNLLYTYYSKDLSKKARKSIEQRKREGCFTCGPVRFGFVKKAGSKVELEIDEKAAQIIRYVFTLAENGIKTKEIAVRLNKEGIMTPAMYSYKYNRKCKWNMAKKEENSWTQSGVAKILRDERYTGTYIEYVEGENGKECIRIPGKYPEIVSYDTFHDAQKVMINRKYPNKSGASDNLFKGIIKCGHCNHALALSRGKQDRYYYCKNSKFDLSKGCQEEHFSEQELKDCVLKAIQDYLSILKKTGEDKVKEYNWKGKKTSGQNKARLEKESQKLEEQFLTLYEQYKVGELSKEEFIEERNAMNSRKQEVEEELAILHEQGDKVIGLEVQRKQFRYEMIAELSEEVVNKYIKKLLIYGKNEIKIAWKLKNPFEDI